LSGDLFAWNEEAVVFKLMKKFVVERLQIRNHFLTGGIEAVEIAVIELHDNGRAMFEQELLHSPQGTFLGSFNVHFDQSNPLPECSQVSLKRLEVIEGFHFDLEPTALTKSFGGGLQRSLSNMPWWFDEKGGALLRRKGDAKSGYGFLEPVLPDGSLEAVRSLRTGLERNYGTSNVFRNGQTVEAKIRTDIEKDLVRFRILSQQLGSASLIGTEVAKPAGEVIAGPNIELYSRLHLNRLGSSSSFALVSSGNSVKRRYLPFENGQT
jgi:hypothetical protein